MGDRKDDRAKAIIGFGENKQGVPMTVFYYLDRLYKEGEDIDRDYLYMDKILRYAYGRKYLFPEDFEEIINRKRKTVNRVAKKMQDKGLLSIIEVLGKRGKVTHTCYMMKDGIYGTAKTEDMYGTADFYEDFKK